MQERSTTREAIGFSVAAASVLLAAFSFSHHAFFFGWFLVVIAIVALINMISDPNARAIVTSGLGATVALSQARQGQYLAAAITATATGGVVLNGLHQAGVFDNDALSEGGQAPVPQLKDWRHYR